MCGQMIVVSKPDEQVNKRVISSFFFLNGLLNTCHVSHILDSVNMCIARISLLYVLLSADILAYDLEHCIMAFHGVEEQIPAHTFRPGSPLCPLKTSVGGGLGTGIGPGKPGAPTGP